MNRIACCFAVLFIVMSPGGWCVEPLVSDVAANAAEWPNWMGPKWDGISIETGWATTWPQDGLPVAWSKEIGIGFSSVSIASGQLYTMGHVNGEEFVWCLNAHTGDEVWSFKYPCGLNDNLHEGGPGATPTIDGDRVYTLGKEGQLFCFNAQTGEVIWKQLLQQDLEVPLPEWGFASSPLIAGDQLLLQGGRVVSYHKLTGEKQWQSPTHRAGYGSAAIMHLSDSDPLVATLDCDGLRLLKLSTGEEVAFQEWDSPFRTNSTTPIVSGNRIYVSSGYNVGCGLYEYAAGKLSEVYANQEMRNHFNNSILWQGHVYGFDGNSNLGRVVQVTCMNFETGAVAWKQRGLGCGSLMIADGKLLMLSEKGELVLAEATPTEFKELARSPFLEGRCWTVPVLLDKRIYGRNAAGKLVCLDLAVTSKM